MNNSKLYLITRKDLTPGAQAAQLVHGMIEFREQHSDIFHDWYKNSNTIVLLAVDDLSELQSLADTAQEFRINHSRFYEPDLNNELTSVILEPTETAKTLCKTLKLALTKPL